MAKPAPLEAIHTYNLQTGQAVAYFPPRGRSQAQLNAKDKTWAALVTTCTSEKLLSPKHTAIDDFGEEKSTAFHNGFLQGVGRIMDSSFLLLYTLEPII